MDVSSSICKEYIILHSLIYVVVDDTCFLLPNSTKSKQNKDF